MNYKLFLILPILFIIPLSAYAEEITPVKQSDNVLKYSGKNYDVIKNYNTGIIEKKLLSYDRLLDYYDHNNNPVYLDYKISHYSDYTNIEMNSQSYYINRTSCDFKTYEGGKINSGQSPTRTLTHLVKESLNSADDWYDLSVTDSTCNVQFIERPDKLTIVATKSNYNQIDNSTSEGGIFKVIYDIEQNGFEWTYDYKLKDTQKDNEYKHGFTFVCDGQYCSDIIVGNSGISLGETLDRDDILEKEILVKNTNFDLKNNQHDRTWVLKHPEQDKFVIDFTYAKGPTQYNESIIVDPQFAVTANNQRFLDTASASSTCSDTFSSNSTATDQIRNPDSGTSASCATLLSYFDISSFDSSNSVEQVILEFDVDTSTNAQNLRINPVTNHPETSSGATLLADIRDGTPYVSSDGSITTTGNNKRVNLGFDAVSDFNTAVSNGDQYFSIGGEFDVELTRDSLDRLVSLSDIELITRYSISDSPSPPVNLEADGLTESLNATFDPSVYDGSDNDASDIQDYYVYYQLASSGFPYFEQPLPDENLQDYNYGVGLDGGLDMSGNQILYHFETIENLNVTDSSGNGINGTSSGFVATEISDLHAWYDADDLDTITKDGSDRVSQWDDKSGNGHHLTQGTAADQPLWLDDDKNGRDVIDFASNRNMVASFTSSTTAPYTMFYVGITGDQNAGENKFTWDGATADEMWFRANSGSDDGLFSAGGTATVATTELVWSVIYVKVASMDSDFEQNDSLLADGVSVGTNSMTGLTLNDKGNIEDRGIDEKVAEVIIYDKSVTGSEKTDVINYLKDKWGISGSSGSSTGLVNIEDGLFSKSAEIENAYINFTDTNNSIRGTNDFNLGVWFNTISAINSPDYGTILSYDSANDFEIRLGNSSIAIYSGSTEIKNETLSYNENSWNHLLVSKQSNIYEIFSNGTELGTSTTDSTDLGTPTNDIYHIGVDTTLSDNFLNATIDEFFVGNSTLVTEISNKDDIFKRGDSSTYSWTLSGATSNSTEHIISSLANGTEYYVRVTSENSVQNSTSFAVVNGTTDDVPTAPQNLSATAVSEDQVDLQWDAPDDMNGDTTKDFAIRVANVTSGSSWLTEVSNSTLASLPVTRGYNDTSNNAGDELVFQVREGNSVGWSPWSSNATAILFEGISATVTLSTNKTGDAVEIIPSVTLDEGVPDPTISNIDILQNGTSINSTSVSITISRGDTKQLGRSYAEQLTSGNTYNFTAVIEITNSTGPFDFTEQTTETPVYTANYVKSAEGDLQVNYTVSRLSDGEQINVVINRQNLPANNDCNFKDELFEAGDWVNGLSTDGWYNKSASVVATRDVVISCYNDDLLFTTTSGGDKNATLAIVDYVNQLGTFAGVPLTFLFVIFLAAIFTGRTALTGIIFLAGTIGVMGIMGFLPDVNGDPAITGTVWGMIILLTALGVFLGKRFF